MKKIHTDKIRATFYIDKRLYQLLKRCSAIEGIPLSSIINNDILEERVGKYAFPSLKDWEDHCYYSAQETEQEEMEDYYEEYEKSPEGLLESKKFLITKQLNEGKMTKALAEKKIEKAQKEYEKTIELEKEKTKLHTEKWERAVIEIPLD